MIPAHENGLLPAGVHAATWAEVAARFGTTARRRRLLDGLFRALTHLAAAGCQTAFLGGSFVTTKAAPKDVDVCWATAGVDLDRLHPMFLDFGVGRTMTLAMFGAEFFPAEVIEGDTNVPFLEFFQQTRDGRVVGIVAVDLESLP